jgi:hypothetical protein
LRVPVHASAAVADNAKQIPVASSSKWVTGSIFGQLVSSCDKPVNIADVRGTLRPCSQLDTGVMRLNDTPSKYLDWWTKDT